MIETFECWKKRTIAAFMLMATLVVGASLVLLEIHTLKMVCVFTLTQFRQFLQFGRFA